MIIKDPLIFALRSIGIVFVLLIIAPRLSADPKVPQVQDAHKSISWDVGHGVKMAFVPIQPGTFMMGSDVDEHDQPVHKVTLTKPFYMGQYEVTQAQWKEVAGQNPSAFKDGPEADRRPVETVSWMDIQTNFLPKLAARLPKGLIPRLPTEAEWEYCCRAGSTTLYCFGDDLDRLSEYAWYDANAEKTTHPVGEKKPNAWGLFDMHGNVWEWCSDWKEPYQAMAVTNPVGPPTGVYRANRGGTWYMNHIYSRSARRSLNEPNATRGGNLGFRVVVTEK